MIKTIIFDFDGTIANTYKTNIKGVNALANEYKYKKIKDRPELRNKTIHKVIKEDLGLSLFQLPGYVKKLKNLVQKDIGKVKPYNGIKLLLNILSNNYQVGILTSNSEESVKRFLQKEDINCINFIHADTSIFGKHFLLRKIIKKMGLKKEETIYVGDEIRDIEAAKKAGIGIISVTWGYNSKKILEKYKPDFIIDKPIKLKNLLELNLR